MTRAARLLGLMALAAGASLGGPLPPRRDDEEEEEFLRSLRSDPTGRTLGEPIILSRPRPAPIYQPSPEEHRALIAAVGPRQANPTKKRERKAQRAARRKGRR
jgi:hypothetical protein